MINACDLNFNIFFVMNDKSRGPVVYHDEQVLATNIARARWSFRKRGHELSCLVGISSSVSKGVFEVGDGRLAPVLLCGARVRAYLMGR